MNGKQLFCLSLILLSVAMGFHWHKNKPKARPKRPQPNRVALNIEDLQLIEDEQEPDEENNATDTGDDQVEGEEGEDSEGSEDSENDEPVEGPEDKIDETTATATAELDELGSDPVIAAIRAIPRNPFVKSPYAILFEELRAQETEEEVEATVKKSVSLINANFSATIGTAKELVAVIDSRLYRTGELFQEKRIKEIKSELVALESDNEIFLIPKVGVNIDIDEDGNYTVDDSFHKN